MASLIRPSLDYTDRDFDAYLARARNLIRGVYPDWTDESVANFGNILVELFCHKGDVLGFYQDQQARESRLVTSILRKSALDHCKMLTYKPRGAEAATVELTARLAAIPVADVEILAGHRFRTQRVTAPITFQALTTAVIPAGSDPPMIVFTAEHSVNASDTFQSSGLPNQEMSLTETPFLDGSLVITAGDGEYEVVDNFLESSSVERHVTVQVDANDRAKIRFGNGITGSIPQGAIVCEYKAGGGAIGNVDADTIRTPEESYADVDGHPVQLSVTNQEGANGGGDRQTVESIKQRAPQSLRALTRTIAEEDYEIHALKVAGVARALMLTSKTRAGIEENHGQLVVVPNGGGQPTDVLRAAVYEIVTVTYPRSITFELEVIGPSYKTINVQATVFPQFGNRGTPVQRQGTLAQRVALAARVRTALQSFFALQLDDGSDNPTADFGLRTDGIVAWSDVLNVIRDVPSIRRIGDNNSDFLLNGISDDVAIEPHEFPQLGTVTLINGFTGAPLDQ